MTETSLLFFAVFILVALTALIILSFKIAADCLRADTSVLNKAIWIIAIIFFWPLGTIVYGVMYPSKRWVFWGAMLSPFLIGLCIFLATRSMPIIFNSIRSEIATTIDRLTEYDTSELTAEEKEALTKNLSVLHEELGSPWHDDFQQKQSNIILYQLLLQHLEDRTLSKEEYLGWQERFELRKLLSLESLADPSVTLADPSVNLKEE